MGDMIHYTEFQEGEIFNKWLNSRLIVNNKNVLGANLGATGSGKSYRDLRMAELWYQYHFKEQFPVENICFGVGKAMELISKGKLRKGEIIIFEEAGVNLGSLDFQQRLSKMMQYVLQSFRSMNIAIFFNLPYLSMLNSSARKLLHYSFESVFVDKKTKQNTCKPFFHQVNQDTGKVYKKYPIVKINGHSKKIKRFSFSMPSQYLLDAYEEKKRKYLLDLTTGFKEEIDKVNNKGKIQVPTPEKIQAYTLRESGKKWREMVEITGRNVNTLQRWYHEVQNYNELCREKVKNRAIVLADTDSYHLNQPTVAV